MAWLFLALAAAFEVGFALSMKASNGFSVFWPSVMTLFGVIGGILFLTLALKTLPVSVGYPIWVGAGALGAVLFGALAFGETISLVKGLSVGAIALGVIGLKVAASS